MIAVPNTVATAIPIVGSIASIILVALCGIRVFSLFDALAVFCGGRECSCCDMPNGFHNLTGPMKMTASAPPDLTRSGL